MANNKMDKRGNLITAAVLGGITGTVAGLLLAPKSGQELRQDLAGQTHKMGEKVVEIKDKAQNAWHNVEDKTQATVNTGKSWFKKGKQLVINLKTLVNEIQNGALTKTGSVTSTEDEDKDNFIKEV